MRKPRMAKRAAGKFDPAVQVRFDIEFAKRTLLESGAVRSMFVVRSATRAKMFLTEFSNGNSKDNVAKLLRVLCVAENAIALSFIAEAWMRGIPRYPHESEAELMARANAVLPSQAHDRIEIILAETTWRDDETGERRTLMEHREIERDAAGRVTGVKPLWFAGETPDRIEGRWVEVLPERAPTATEQQAAAEVLEDLQQALGIEIIAVPQSS